MRLLLLGGGLAAGHRRGVEIVRNVGEVTDGARSRNAPRLRWRVLKVRPCRRSMSIFSSPFRVYSFVRV